MANNDIANVLSRLELLEKEQIRQNKNIMHLESELESERISRVKQILSLEEGQTFLLRKIKELVTMSETITSSINPMTQVSGSTNHLPASIQQAPVQTTILLKTTTTALSNSASTTEAATSSTSLIALPAVPNSAASVAATKPAVVSKSTLSKSAIALPAIAEPIGSRPEEYREEPPNGMDEDEGEISWSESEEDPDEIYDGPHTKNVIGHVTAVITATEAQPLFSNIPEKTILSNEINFEAAEAKSNEDYKYYLLHGGTKPGGNYIEGFDAHEEWEKTGKTGLETSIWAPKSSSSNSKKVPTEVENGKKPWKSGLETSIYAEKDKLPDSKKMPAKNPGLLTTGKSDWAEEMADEEPNKDPAFEPKGQWSHAQRSWPTEVLKIIATRGMEVSVKWKKLHNYDSDGISKG